MREQSIKANWLLEEKYENYIAEAKKEEDMDTDADDKAVDIEKVLKIFGKLEKYTETLEDEKLTKIIDSLKKALGAEDEDESKAEQDKEDKKKDKKEDKDDVDLDDLSV